MEIEFTVRVSLPDHRASRAADREALHEFLMALARGIVVASKDWNGHAKTQPEGEMPD